MKKLMTLLSAAAVAFGLQAADTGTSFEGMSAGDLDITSSIDELAAGTSGYWVTNGNEKVSLTVTAGTSLVRENPLTITQFGEEDQDFYLSVKTPFGNPVTRKIKADSTTQLIGNDGFYFDSLVKFTAFDEDPLTTAVANDFDGAKIAVWIQEVSENEVVTGTNLYVRAGYLGGQPQTYDCGRLLSPDGWKRLTIKAIKNIYVTGSENNVPAFVVFINGEPVGSLAQKGIVAANLDDKYEGYNITGSLFPSLAQTGDENDVLLSSVSYDGQGDVDDLVFTATAPKFARDAEYVYIKWTPADITALTIDGTDLTSEQIAAGSYKVTYADDLSVAVSATYVEGKLDGTWTTTGGATVSDGTFSFTASEETGTIVAAGAAASFQGTPYATLAGAIAAAEEASATLPPPVLKLYNTSASDDIEIAPNALIVIDLNGQEIGGISTKDALQIIDSVGGGTVKGEVYLGEESVINAGTFDEMVTLGDGSVINGGRFIFDLNEGQVEEFAAEGYEFVAGTGADEGYLVLVEKAEEVDFAVSAGANSYVSEVIVNGFDVTTSVTNGTLEAVSSNATWSVTFTANAGYQFEGGLTTTNFTGTAEAAVAVVGPAASEIPATPSFTVTPGSNSTVTEVLVNGNNVTADVPATLTEGDTWSVTFTADTDYAFDGGATTTNFTGTAAKVAIVVEGPAAAKQQGGWVDPGTIPADTDAGTQYPELADSALATADAKKLTEWAEAKSVQIGTVAAAAKDSAIYDAYLLNCDVDDVEDARADFVPSISIVDGVVTVTAPTAPQGGFNGTLNKKGSANLKNWYDANESNAGYNFFKYELVP